MCSVSYSILRIILWLHILWLSWSNVSGHCFEELTAKESVQVIRSPSYPGRYGDYISCTWILHAEEEGSQVEVLFTGVRTEACCDYILIRDGHEKDASVVGNLRGILSSPRSFVSTFGALYITFDSDDSITDRGFQFQYRVSVGDTGCGMNVNAVSSLQFLSSPGWPSSYPNNAYCTWIIYASSGKNVHFTILSMNTERCCDNLVIRDGLSESSRVLSYLSGSLSTREDLISSENILHVRFRSDHSEGSDGFFAYYYSDWPTYPTSDTNLADCNYEQTAPLEGYSYFTSPNFPRLYPHTTSCSWIISAPVGQHVRVWFGYVYTERCCDWIKIRDGRTDTSPKLGSVSGNSWEFSNFISSGNNIRIDFETSSMQNYRGFYGYYEAYNPALIVLESQSECGGNLTVNSTLQYLSTSNWPSSYNNNEQCLWVISADMGKSVMLHFLGIITEPEKDDIKIYNGDTESSPLMLTLTGKHHNRYIFTSTGSHLTVSFQSNENTTFGGFQATVVETTPLGEELVLSSDQKNLS